MGYKPMPVFKTGAFDHSAISPNERYNSSQPLMCKYLSHHRPVECLFEHQIDALLSKERTIGMVIVLESITYNTKVVIIQA